MVLMDDIIFKIPPTLETPVGKAYLIVAAWDEGWQACYVYRGLAFRGFHGYGRSPSEAILNLKESLDLLGLLEAPAIVIDESKPA